MKKLTLAVLLLAVMAIAPLGANSAKSDAGPVIAHGDPPEPAIHAPHIVGTTPGHPFIFRVPATGEGKLVFSAADLPPGLSLDPASGVISGALASEGKFIARITISGAKGSATRNLVIVGGKDQLALTPPMGWNSWNVWGTAISEEKIRAAADAMIASGLAAHGFQFINIDDGWQTGKEGNNPLNLLLISKSITHNWVSGRDSSGEIVPNPDFPDMKALGDYIHGKGLKFGVYSSPGPKTCAMYEGSLGHEAQDAAAYARWGVDYLKYDWCSYGVDQKKFTGQSYIDAYKKMGDQLRAQNRDIVYSLCEYGQYGPWKWGPSVGGNLWRTTGDVKDKWNGNALLVGITRSFKQSKIASFAGPGHWNDPDMLVVGKVGWGPKLHETRLTKDEQLTHLTLWSMAAAPLMIGCNMTELDQFTTDLLTNSEVLEVDQDPLGQAAVKKSESGEGQVWARPLWDGTLAVALYNRGGSERQVTAAWSDLGLSGPQPVRDLWQRKDLGPFDNSITAPVRPHGAVLFKIGTPREKDFGLTK